jgi:uncharacterized membrane protein YhaH (DUF805 family)
LDRLDYCCCRGACDRNRRRRIVSAWLLLLATTDLLDFFGWLPTRINLNVFAPANLLLFAYTMIAGVVSLALLMELCFRRGTNGSNRYGPDPLAMIVIAASTCYGVTDDAL